MNKAHIASNPAMVLDIDTEQADANKAFAMRMHVAVQERFKRLSKAPTLYENSLGEEVVQVLRPHTLNFQMAFALGVPSAPSLFTYRVKGTRNLGAYIQEDFR